MTISVVAAVVVILEQTMIKKKLLTTLELEEKESKQRAITIEMKSVKKKGVHTKINVFVGVSNIFQ